MAQEFIDRLLTVVVTATLTSAAWIIAGSSFVEAGGSDRSAEQQQTERPVLTSPGSAGPVGGEETRSDTAPLLIPVAGVAATQLSDTFADARGGGGRRHDALDIMAPAGTLVIAAAAGKVERLFRSDAGGNTIYVRSPDGRTIHYYAHLRDYAAGLKEGQQVRRGERLGTVGSTGNADPAAPHLHFAVMRTTPDAQWWEPATAINPYPLMVRQN